MEDINYTDKLNRMACVPHVASGEGALIECTCILAMRFALSRYEIRLAMQLMRWLSHSTRTDLRSIPIYLDSNDLISYDSFINLLIDLVRFYASFPHALLCQLKEMEICLSRETSWVSLTIYWYLKHQSMLSSWLFECLEKCYDSWWKLPPAMSLNTVLHILLT